MLKILCRVDNKIKSIRRRKLSCSQCVFVAAYTFSCTCCCCADLLCNNVIRDYPAFLHFRRSAEVAKIYRLFILILHAKKTPQMKSGKLSKVLLLSHTIKEIADIKLSLSIPLQHTGGQRHSSTHS